MILSSDFKSKLFERLNLSKKYFNLHGGVQFELETCHLEKLESDYDDAYEEIASTSTKILNNYLNSEQMHQYTIPTVKVYNKKLVFCFVLFI